MRNQWSFILLTVFALQSVFGCGSSPAPPVWPDLPEKRTGDPNLDYWLFLNAEFSSKRLLQSSNGGQQNAAALPDDFVTQSTVHKLLRASGQDVDPELVAWALKIANHYSESCIWSAFMDQLAASDRASQRQLSANPRGSWLAATMGSNLFSANQALREEAEQLRRTLSARYGRDFPPSSF